ncbi:MAG: flagellar basal-body MS-ring/collar protein FliF [Acidimicrobiales bacterium]
MASRRPDMTRVRETLQRFSSGFTPGQKAVTLVAVAALGIGGVLFAQLASKPTYAPLFTGLQASDAASITSKLQAAKVPYQLADNGQSILVPQADVYQERLDMAQAGLPASGTVGLSLLDKEGITTSQFTQQADYQRAIQGELEQTIDAINGVTGSQVDVVMPPTDVFSVSNAAKATASVLVTLKPGVTLSTGQVQGIVHLVASAVPNLAPNDVTVVDQSGNVLAAPGVDGSSGSQQDQTQAYDQAVAGSLQGMLSQLVGQGKAVVVVHSTLDFDQVSTTSQSLQTNPKGQVVTVPVQNQTSKETYTGNGAPPGGVLGNPAPTVGTSQSGSYNSSTTNSSYAVGKVTKTVKQAPGQVKRMSVAVLLDSSATHLPSSSITRLVSAAAGLVTSRGDSVSVVRAPFSNASAKAAASQAKAAAAARSQAAQMDLIKTFGLLLLAIAAVFLLWRSSRKERRTEVVLPPVTAYPLEAPPPRELQGPNRAEEVDDLIEEQPEEVAKLLRSWMAGRGAP